ncbi:hypothetical protein TNCV_3220071 [Trichonephila clavipes]|nr:hypothetical protein TNCV_3220071 [Trichonephila clavipes]
MLRMKGVNELLMLLPSRLAAPIEAPESLLVVRHERQVCLAKSHTYSKGLRSEIVPANPYSISSLSKSVRQLLCDNMVHCRP